jgi:hypothetical protein
MGLFVPQSHHGPPQKLSVLQAANVVSDEDEKTTTTLLAAISPLKRKQQQHRCCSIYKKKKKATNKKPKKKQTKRVIFAAAPPAPARDTTTTTNLTIEYYANATLSQSDLKDPKIKKKLWWTKHDKLRSTKESLGLLKAFKFKNVQDIENYRQIYKTSILMYQSPSQIVSDYLEKVTVSIPLSIRGLEWGLPSSGGSGGSGSPKGGSKGKGGAGVGVGGMISVKSLRKQHIENILTVQKHIKDQEIRQRFISSRSLQSSRPSRIMARMIGEGDALKSFSNQLQTTNTNNMNTTDNNSSSSSSSSSTGIIGITTDSSSSSSSSSSSPTTTTTTKNHLKQQQQKKGTGTSIKVTPSKNIGQVRKRRRQLLWRK